MDDSEITKVQELIYTTRVETVMAQNVLVIGPSASTNDARLLMRQKRVTGLPVLENDRLVGIITLSDVIRALEAGRLDVPVSEHMTREVKTVSKDAYVAELMRHLGREGFARLPVVDGDGKVVGIVTTGTVMQSLIRQMDASYKKKEQERLQTYRASHVFEDILSEDTSLILRFIVDDKDFDNAGKASSQIKKSLQRLSVSPALVRRVAVAVYEAEINLVIHTDVGGELTADIRRDRIHISAVDHGPGIANVELVLQPGFSTAPEWIRNMGFGAGMGLANIKRCSDRMKLISTLGGGTRLEIFFFCGDNPIGVASSSRKKA